jgi:hypothetical protein
MDRLTFPERGARYFQLATPVTVCGAGVTLVLLNYTFPDMVEGVIRGFGLGATGNAVAIQALQASVTLDSQPIPPAVNTGVPFVALPYGTEKDFFQEIGRSRANLRVTFTNPSAFACSVYARFSGWYYLSNRRFGT